MIFIPTVAVGGTAAALYARHRVSLDVDFVTPYLRDQFDQVESALRDIPGFAIARLRRPVLILGRMGDDEIGIRQLRRREPLEIVEQDGLCLPTLPEMIRVKSFVLSDRRAVRDYVDVCALVETAGMDAAVQAMLPYARLYEGLGTAGALPAFAEATHDDPVDLGEVDLRQWRLLNTVPGPRPGTLRLRAVRTRGHQKPRQSKATMTPMNSLSRRCFLRTAAALAVPSLIPARMLGAESPSHQINVGFIGTGDPRHHLEPPPLPELQMTRGCASSATSMASACVAPRKSSTNSISTRDCAMTKDFREVLARADLDAVMISTPDHWHTLMSVLALRAGKDVQCEKPTLTIDEGKILIETVRRHNRVFQTSTEDRSIPVYHRMAELVRNGRIGKLRKIEVVLPKQPSVPGDPAPQPVPTELDWEHVARSGPARPLHQGPGPFQLPLDLGLLRRDHLRLGHAPFRHRAMGQRHRTQRPRRN